MKFMKSPQAVLIAILCALFVSFGAPQFAFAQDHAADSALETSQVETHGAAATAGEHGTDGEHGEASGPKSPFDPHYGTTLNWLARMISGEKAPNIHRGEDGVAHITNEGSIKYDVFVVAVLVVIGLALAGRVAGKKAQLRPEGKPTSLPNLFEAGIEGFYDYLVGIMGRNLANKYTPLIATFFFTILVFNWLGLVPGLAAPTANANIPIAMAIVAFFATHIIAIKEVGVKSWFMHFVGEPKWLAFLNFPLHIIGEIIKPLSLAIRLLCNVFGEEMVILQLTTLSVALLPWFLPIPFQFPMMVLGVFFGALQALVFATLLAIYISILSTHHDDHDEHGNPGHVEHTTIHGREQIIAHGTQTTVA